MSTLSKAERDKLPASSFGDPQRRLFPILDQDDVDSAAHLIGKAKNPDAVKKRIIAIAKRLKLTLPDAWQESATHGAGGPMTRSVATFDLEGSGRYVDGEWAVYPNSLLFEAGEYADKDYAMTPEELWAAVEQFRPVDGNIEHTDFLRGKACHVRSIRLDEQDSARLRGEVALPLWLDEQLSSAERKLSCEWDRASKELTGLGLVVHPRVPDASLMAAYAAFARPKNNTPTGQRHLQQIHDLTVERGAICDPGNSPDNDADDQAKMASQHERRTLQQIHDMAAQHGARCEVGGTVSAPPLLYSKEKRRMDFKALFSGLFGAIEEHEQTPSPAGQPTLAPARAQDLPANVSGVTPAPQTVAPVVQNGQQAWTPAVATGNFNSGVSAPVVDPRVAELEKQLAERDATIAREAEARIQREASLFAEEQVRAQKATPAEQEKLAATFAQAMRDDQRHEPVTFAEAPDKVGQTSRVQQLRDVFEARPAGVLQSAVLPDGQDGAAASALFNKQQTERVGPDGKKVEGPLSEDRRRALLAGSSLGRAIVRDESKNGHPK